MLRSDSKELIYFQLYRVVPAVSVFRPPAVSFFFSVTTSIPLSDFSQSNLKDAMPPREVVRCHKHVSPSLFTDLELIKKAKAHPPPPPPPPPAPPAPPLPLFANIHVSFVIKCGDDVNLCCRHWLSLLLIDLFLGQNELLCSLLSFVLQPPSSSLQLLLKLLRLTKVNGSGCPLLLLFMAIDRGLRWVFIHLAGAWIECVGCLG